MRNPAGDNIQLNNTNTLGFNNGLGNVHGAAQSWLVDKYVQAKCGAGAGHDWKTEE